MRFLAREDELPDLWLEELDFACDPLDRLDEPLRLVLLPDLWREELDFAFDPLDRLDEPLRPVLLPRFDVERLARLVFEDRLWPDRAGFCCCFWERSLAPLSAPSCSSSPFPMSFFATPTAAGTATPMAAPARTFLPVDTPSLSLSFSSSILNLHLLVGTRQL